MTKGTTWDQFPQGDITHLFRRQDNRSLREIDLLLERQEYLRSQLGAEKADDIERQPDYYYNHERFRIWQAQARFRAFLTTLITVPIIATAITGGQNGIGLIRKHKAVAAVGSVGLFASYFFLFHRMVGYSNQSYMEQTYAKNFKMLRNIIIKQ